MAGVTSEILNNMLRSNFNNLKSFAEQLNAELTEEGQGMCGSLYLYVRPSCIRDKYKSKRN